jgi:hypothetical protein
MADDFEQSLFTGVAADASHHIVSDQYKLYVEAANATSERRQATNQFFLGMTTGLCVLIGYLYSEEANGDLKKLVWCVPIAGALVSWFWMRLLESYSQLNTAKYKVIHAMESRLPLAPFKAEWACLDEGKNPKVYAPLTQIESRVPRSFLVVFIVLFTVSVWPLICNTDRSPAQPPASATKDADSPPGKSQSK